MAWLGMGFGVGGLEWHKPEVGFGVVCLYVLHKGTWGSLGVQYVPCDMLPQEFKKGALRGDLNTAIEQDSYHLDHACESPKSSLLERIGQKKCLNLYH